MSALAIIVVLVASGLAVGIVSLSFLTAAAPPPATAAQDGQTSLERQSKTGEALDGAEEPHGIDHWGRRASIWHPHGFWRMKEQPCSPR
jgi:hypothetical protein